MLTPAASARRTAPPQTGPEGPEWFALASLRYFRWTSRP